MIPRLQSEFYWPGSMGSDVRRVVTSTCGPCARTHLTRMSSVLGDSESRGAPARFQILQADLFYCEKQWFLTIIDCFSGLSWALPLHDKSATSVARAFQVYYCALFGAPARIQTDHGSEFAGVFDDVCRRLGVQHRHGTLFNSRSESRVERLHRTLIPLVAKILLVTPNDVVAAVAQAGVGCERVGECRVAVVAV